jgi:hypothetical protein
MTDKQKELTRSLVVAGLLIATALAAVAARRLGYVTDPQLGARFVGIFSGLVLAAYGNVIPRRLVRYEPGSPRPARRQAAMRFAGWAFVLAGLASALVWAFAPSTSMALWSMVPIAAALALVVLRCLRSRMERNEA